MQSPAEHSIPPQDDSNEEPISEAKIHEVMDRIRAQQNFPLAVIAGMIGSVIGAILWAAVTVATKHQIGWMSIGIGFLCGFGVRTFGKGLSKIYGFVGAIFALLGCLAGNILSVCGLSAVAQGISFFDILQSVLVNPPLIGRIMVDTFSPMDLLFYGIAVFEGYKLSFREITEAEAVKMLDS